MDEASRFVRPWGEFLSDRGSYWTVYNPANALGAPLSEKERRSRGGLKESVSPMPRNLSEIQCGARASARRFAAEISGRSPAVQGSFVTDHAERKFSGGAEALALQNYVGKAAGRFNRA
jgi:hypothetical protein